MVVHAFAHESSIAAAFCTTTTPCATTHASGGLARLLLPLPPAPLFCRDNLVNLSQILATTGNLTAIVLAALPMLLPEDLIPAWVRGPIVMWLAVVCIHK